MKNLCIICLCLILTCLTGFADTGKSASTSTNSTAIEREIQHLQDLMVQAKAQGQAPNPAWSARLNELYQSYQPSLPVENLSNVDPSQNTSSSIQEAGRQEIQRLQNLIAQAKARGETPD